MQPPVKQRYYKLEMNTDLTIPVVITVTTNSTVTMNLNKLLRDYRETEVLCSTNLQRFSSGDSGARHEKTRKPSDTGRA